MANKEVKVGDMFRCLSYHPNTYFELVLEVHADHCVVLYPRMGHGGEFKVARLERPGYPFTGQDWVKVVPEHVEQQEKE